MDLDRLFENKDYLNKKYDYYVRQEILRRISPDKDLVFAHLMKAKNNLLFFEKNKHEENFNDWLIVILYYSLYHIVLSLIVNKNYISKNHNASLVFLIKHYSEFKDNIKLLDDLSIKKRRCRIIYVFEKRSAKCKLFYKNFIF